MFTLLKLRHRALVSATPSVPFGNQAKCLIEWGKFTGHALWPVAGENENQPLDTHHPDRETVLYRGGRDACATLRSGHRCHADGRAACSAEPISHILDIEAFNRRDVGSA
ncbi:hypothetical protein ACU8OJ_33915 (plasmid) [Rhizobium leguminosarum]|jgi:hypothetical protein